MGSWGSGISSNDTFADIYGEFKELYDAGLEVEEISNRLINSHQETINDPDDSNNFWFALAKAQWECKCLDPAIFNKVSELVVSGRDLEVWRKLGADEKTIKERKDVLDKFVSDLSKEKLKPKQRKKEVIRQPAFAKGDCFSFKLDSGNYGGAVVLEALHNTANGYNLIVTTRINQPNKPNKIDFEKSEVLILNFGNYNEKQCIHWFSPIRFKKVSHLFDKCANIPVNRDFDPNKLGYDFCGDFDIWIIEQANRQFDFEKKNRSSIKRIKLKEITGSKSKWSLW